MKLDEIIRTGLSRVDAVAVKRTAINPALWLVGLVTPLSLLLAAFVVDPETSLILMGFAAAPVIFTFVIYAIWMFREPDRLQSEEYRIKQQALKYLYKKGGNTEIVDVANQPPRIEKSHIRSDSGEAS